MQTHDSYTPPEADCKGRVGSHLTCAQLRSLQSFANDGRSDHTTHGVSVVKVGSLWHKMFTIDEKPQVTFCHSCYALANSLIIMNA